MYVMLQGFIIVLLTSKSGLSIILNDAFNRIATSFKCKEKNYAKPVDCS